LRFLKVRKARPDFPRGAFSYIIERRLPIPLSTSAAHDRVIPS
jgi:hypothetical protein